MPLPRFYEPRPAVAEAVAPGNGALCSENPMFDLNRWVQKAPSNHVAYAVGLCFLLYYWNLIVTLALIFGALWLIDKMRGGKN